MQKGHPKSSPKGVDMQSTSAVTKIWGEGGLWEEEKGHISNFSITATTNIQSNTHKSTWKY